MTNSEIKDNFNNDDFDLKKEIKGIIFFHIWLIIGLLCIEVLCHFSKLSHKTNIKPPLKYNKNFQWEYVANFKGTKNNKPYFFTNSYGLKEKEFAVKKPKNEIRWLFLGNSVTIAEEQQKRFTEYIGLKLKKDFPKMNIFPINAGIAGYRILQQYYWLKIKGLPLSPDLVIMNLTLFDIPGQRYLAFHLNRLLKNYSAFYRLSNNVYVLIKYKLKYLLNLLTSMGKNASNALKNDIPKKSTSSSDTLDRKEILSRVNNIGSLPGNIIFPDIIHIEPWEGRRLFKRLSMIQDLLQSKQIPLVVVIFPIRPQYVNDYRQPQEEIIKICTALHIPYYDLFDIIKKNDPVLIFNDPLHLTEFGHEVVGNFLADKLEKQFLISRKNSS